MIPHGPYWSAPDTWLYFKIWSASFSFSGTDGLDGGSDDGGGGAVGESEAIELDDELGLYHFSNLSLFLVHQSKA